MVFDKEQEMDGDELFIYYWLLCEDGMVDNSWYCDNRGSYCASRSPSPSFMSAQGLYIRDTYIAAHIQVDLSTHCQTHGSCNVLVVFCKVVLVTRALQTSYPLPTSPQTTRHPHLNLK